MSKEHLVPLYKLTKLSQKDLVAAVYMLAGLLVVAESGLKPLAKKPADAEAFQKAHSQILHEIFEELNEPLKWGHA